MIALPTLDKSVHQLAVEEFHIGMGQTPPTTPTVPSDAQLLARCKLLLEEALEFVEAAGVKISLVELGNSEWKIDVEEKTIRFNDLRFAKVEKADLIGMADGLADTMVICAGGLAICGIADMPLLREVDNNNLLKISTGHFDKDRGKFIKAPNHPKPDIAGVLKEQGWTND